MTTQFHVGLPNKEQRSEILRLILGNENVTDDVDLVRLADKTNGFSGSDLRELCRNASVYRLREFMKQNDTLNAPPGRSISDLENPPPISMQDLTNSFIKMRESKVHTGLMPGESRIELD